MIFVNLCTKEISVAHKVFCSHLWLRSNHQKKNLRASVRQLLKHQKCVPIRLQCIIAADRNGDWEGHLIAVQQLLPMFAECDSINYLCYGSSYLELMQHLPVDHPAVYSEFMHHHFVMKCNSGSFNAVAADHSKVPKKVHLGSSVKHAR